MQHRALSKAHGRLSPTEWVEGAAAEQRTEGAGPFAREVGMGAVSLPSESHLRIFGSVRWGREGVEGVGGGRAAELAEVQRVFKNWARERGQQNGRIR